jgi:hypothetical protein
LTVDKEPAPDNLPGDTSGDIHFDEVGLYTLQLLVVEKTVAIHICIVLEKVLDVRPRDLNNSEIVL